MLKRLLVLGLLVMLGLFLAQGALAQEKIKIGILLFSNQAHYVSAQKGIIEALKKEGFDENKVVFEIRDAEGNKEKVTEIVKELKAKGMNLIMPIGTPAAIGAAEEIKDIPIVFSSVFDPVGAGIAKGWESSGNNTTGVSTWVDMSSMVSTIRKLCPGKRIGVIYTEAEKQTVLQLEEFKKIQIVLGFTVVPAHLTKVEDATNVAESLVGQVDSIFTTGGTVVGEATPAIMEVLKKAKIVTASHLPERAEKYGVLLAVAANSFQLGELAGRKASQVLRGRNPADIPIEPLRKYDITINKKTAKEMGLGIPDSLLEIAIKVVE